MTGALWLALTPAPAPASRWPSAVDPAFQTGLAAWLSTNSIAEAPVANAPAEWAPHLQLLIGVKAVAGRKETVHFIELTTLPSISTLADDEATRPKLQTNRLDWSSTNANAGPLEFVTRLMPARVRVLDDAARVLESAEIEVPWDVLTNSLANACALALSGAAEDSAVSDPAEADSFRRPFAIGMLSLLRVFAMIQSTPALAKVCKTARCAVRLPSAWTLLSAAFGARLDVSLDPRFRDVAALPETPGAPTGAYLLPMDMKIGDRILTTVEITTRPADGPRVLLAGAEAIRAIHPTRPDHEFTARVLVAGVATPPDERR